MAGEVNLLPLVWYNTRVVRRRPCHLFTVNFDLHMMYLIHLCFRYACSKSGHIFEVDYKKVTVSHVRQLHAVVKNGRGGKNESGKGICIILGIMFTDTLGSAPHFTITLSQATCIPHVRPHGLHGNQLYKVSQATWYLKCFTPHQSAVNCPRFQSVMDRCSLGWPKYSIIMKLIEKIRKICYYGPPMC